MQKILYSQNEKNIRNKTEFTIAHEDKCEITIDNKTKIYISHSVMNVIVTPEDLRNFLLSIDFKKMNESSYKNDIDLFQLSDKSSLKEYKFNMNIPDSLYDNNGYLTKDKLMDKVVQIVHDNWEYSDFDYNPDNDVLDIHFGNPSDTDGINATQYDAKLMQKWAIEIQPSVKSLNLVLLDVFRSHGYQTHVNLYYHNGFQHENIILATMDGKVMYDYFLNIDAQ